MKIYNPPPPQIQQRKVYEFACSSYDISPLMHKAPKWSDTSKQIAAFAARFLKCF